MKIIAYICISKHLIMKRKLLLLLTVISLAMTFSACGDDDYGVEEYIVGQWALQSVNNMPPSQEIDYVFRGNLTGAIKYNAGYPNQYSSPFEWETYYAAGGASYVTLYNYDGSRFRYIYRIESAYKPGYGNIWYLYLTDLDTGDNLVFQEY